MATKLLDSYQRDLNPEAVPLDEREAGFCIACGSKAERDPITSHWWHLESRYCSDPNATFVGADGYDMWCDYETSLREVHEGLERNRVELDLLQEKADHLKHELAEKSARHLRRMRIMLVAMLCVFLCSLLLPLLGR